MLDSEVWADEVPLGTFQLILTTWELEILTSRFKLECATILLSVYLKLLHLCLIGNAKFLLINTILSTSKLDFFSVIVLIPYDNKI